MAKLRIPANISIRKEIWKGITLQDGLRLAVASLLVIGIAVAYVKLIDPNAQLHATVVVLICITFCYLFLSRLDYLSPYDMVKIYLRYGKEQQVFRFKKEEKAHGEKRK